MANRSNGFVSSFMKFYRDYCCECGRPESWRSAFKRWLRWSKLGQWWEPYVPGPYEKYYDREVLESVAFHMKEALEHRPFPKEAGATTIRFTKPVKDRDLS
jgi:hypothetical protein